MRMIRITTQGRMRNYITYPPFSFREEMALRKAEMEATKVENMILHRDEIYSRPKRTWFATEKDKKLIAKSVKVANQFIASIRKSCDPAFQMSFFISFDVEDILRQANESTLRYERGEPLSALDGVPIAVKDEIDCLPYPTTGGTKWLHKVRPCTDDADCVKRLKLCGAILVGKTNMHELGAGTSGINPHYGSTRNPYDVNKITGGSSSGSAAVVSAGLCPAALGVDGGASDAELHNRNRGRDEVRGIICFARWTNHTITDGQQSNIVAGAADIIVKLEIEFSNLIC